MYFCVDVCAECLLCHCSVTVYVNKFPAGTIKYLSVWLWCHVMSSPIANAKQRFKSLNFQIYALMFCGFITFNSFQNDTTNWSLSLTPIGSSVLIKNMVPHVLPISFVTWNKAEHLSSWRKCKSPLSDCGFGDFVALKITSISGKTNNND